MRYRAIFGPPPVQISVLVDVDSPDRVQAEALRLLALEPEGMLNAARRALDMSYYDQYPQDVIRSGGAGTGQ